MPTFFVIDGVKIELYFRDHNPPHFHAIIAEYNALITIKGQKLLEGSLPKNKINSVLNWASENEEVLLTIWNSLRK